MKIHKEQKIPGIVFRGLYKKDAKDIFKHTNALPQIKSLMKTLADK